MSKFLKLSSKWHLSIYHICQYSGIDNNDISEFLIFLFNYQIAIESEDNFIFLCLTINTNMSWTKHVDKIALRILRPIGIINIKIHPTMPCAFDIVQLVNLSVYKYFNTLLGYQHNEITQLQAIRAIIRSRYLAHTKPLFQNRNFLKVEDIFKLNN